MKQKTKEPRKLSTASREKMSQSAKARHAAKADDIEKAVRLIVAVIAIEALENNGVYPQNNGHISAAEVARRAGIHIGTLHREGYETLHGEVSTWVDSFKKKEENSSSYTGKRMSLAERYKILKQDYKRIEEDNLLIETDLQHAQLTLETANKEIERLKGELGRNRR